MQIRIITAHDGYHVMRSPTDGGSAWTNLYISPDRAEAEVIAETARVIECVEHSSQNDWKE